MLPLSETELAPGRSTGPPLAALWSVAVVSLAAHNVEEWLLDLTGWMADHPGLPGGTLHGDPTRFALALLIVTAAFAGTAAVAVASRASWSPVVLGCAAYALVANGASHVVLSVLTGEFMPGVLTGTLLLAPVGLVIIRRMPPVRWTTGTVLATLGAALAFVFGSLGLAAALAPLL